jgi:hypothetical protein
MVRRTHRLSLGKSPSMYKRLSVRTIHNVRNREDRYLYLSGAVLGERTIPISVLCTFVRMRGSLAPPAR